MNFTRKIFTFPLWIKYTGKFILCLPRLALIKYTQSISSSLQGKILLSTTSINKRVLCARFASEMAFKEGVNQTVFILHAPVIIPSWIYVKQKKNDFSFLD